MATALHQFDLSPVRQQLSGNMDCDVQSIVSLFEQYAALANTEDRFDLEDGARIMSQLIQLLELSQDPEFRDGISSFILERIDCFESEQDSETILGIVQESRDRWSEYLGCLEDSGITEEEEHWHDDDSSEGEMPEGDELPVTDSASNDIALLLSAVNKPDSAPVAVDAEGATQSSASSKADQVRDLIEDEDLREAFMDDAMRGLDVMEKCSLAFEQNSNDKESVTQFCRELHTLKGASASVGLSDMASEIHEVETALAGVNQPDKVVELMLGIVDQVRTVIQRLNPVTEEQTDAEKNRTGPREFIETVNLGSGGSDDSLVRIRASKLDRLMDMLAELVVLRNRRESHLSELAEFNVELKRCADRLGHYAADPVGPDSSEFKSSLTLSELSKDINDLSSDFRQLQRPVNKDNLAISHFIRDFRHELMQLRRIPISGLLNRIQRSARDAAKSESKLLTFEVAGEDSGLERELQEKLFEPLLHIVRNAVSHGIETPTDREKVGKAPSGCISLTAQSNSQVVAITVSDDGQGLDYEAIRRRGLEKNLIQPNQFLNENELAKLIFHPGFSTREAASEVSGRGVGMDVVMSTVQQMRGRIEIESTPGSGTSMTIVIPVRAGIEHVMVFRSGGQLFALPMQSVSKARSFSKESNEVTMASVLGISDVAPESSKEVLMMRSQGNGRKSQQIGFAVDEILGPEEVVIRKLPTLLQGHPLFSGLTLSGAGETALLLDAERLAKFNRNINAVSSTPKNSTNSSRAINILVVDDSMSARKLLSKKLFAHGFNVVEAADGVEGLDQIRNGSFDLVFTDLDMPKMGGLELLFDLQQGRHKDQKVVVVSSRSAEEFGHRAMDLGALAYMTKPVEDYELEGLLNELQLNPEQ